MKYLGYHCSINKSFYKSLRKEYEKKDIGGNAYQIFIKTPRRKSLSKLNEKDAESCRNFIYENNIYLVAHSTYLINMANPFEDNTYPVDTAIDDLLAIEKLGGRGSVFHVGKHKNRDYDECLENMQNFVKYVIDRTPNCNSKFILETAAGCGTEMLCKIEELGAFYHSFEPEYKSRMCICLDTCHVFSAGYDLRTVEKVDEFIDLVGDHIKWSNVELIHLNDSKTVCDSGIDRHENLGKGYIGNESLEGLKHFISFCKEHEIPMILETPMNEHRATDMDILEG